MVRRLLEPSPSVEDVSMRSFCEVSDVVPLTRWNVVTNMPDPPALHPLILSLGLSLSSFHLEVLNFFVTVGVAFNISNSCFSAGRDKTYLHQQLCVSWRDHSRAPQALFQLRNFVILLKPGTPSRVSKVAGH